RPPPRRRPRPRHAGDAGAPALGVGGRARRGVHGRRGARRAVPVLRLRSPQRAGLRDPAGPRPRRARPRPVCELREAEARAPPARDPARQAGPGGGGAAATDVLPPDPRADEGEPEALGDLRAAAARIPSVVRRLAALAIVVAALAGGGTARGGGSPVALVTAET